MVNRQKNAIRPGVGLHLLKRDFQKRFMADQCFELLLILDEAIACTLKAAPVREAPYLQPRSSTPPEAEPQNPEARLERRLYRQWASSEGPGCEFWRGIVCYQVNLPNTLGDSDWGEIDLLAVSAAGLPVVVELKAGDSSETPAAMLVQAAAYALALRKAWGRFRLEWCVEVGRRFPGLLSALPVCLEQSPLVCAAPSEYWREWIGKRPRARAVGAGSGTALRELQTAFSTKGLPSVFVDLGGADEHPYAPRAVDLSLMR